MSGVGGVILLLAAFLFADPIGKRYLLRLAGKQGGKRCRKVPEKAKESEGATDDGDGARTRTIR